MHHEPYKAGWWDRVPIERQLYIYLFNLFLQKSRDLVCFFTYTPTSWNSAWHVAGATHTHIHTAYKGNL